MKKVIIESPVYKEKEVKFDGIVMKFNAEGKAQVEIKDEQEAELKEVLATYPNIYLEGQAPKAEVKKETTAASANEKQQEEKDAIIASLKQSNINLAKEKKVLEAEKNKLKAENEELKAKIATLTGDNKGGENQKPENQEKTEEEKAAEEEEIKKELNGKTLKDLNAILNDVYAEFKEEWAGLKTKEEIVNYIISKK